MSYSSEPPNLYNAIAAILGGGPIAPGKLTKRYQDEIFTRLCARNAMVSERVEASTQGRVVPDENQLAIGEGRHLNELAILFLDICQFSDIPNWSTDEQKIVLKTLNIFMAEMLAVVRDFNGIFEKNTG